MYNLVFNYRGYMLDMIKTKTPNSCVPEYILNTLNNKEEKDGRKKISKLTLQDTLNDLGMKCIDEGCSINQIADFCNKRKVIYYALDYKYKLFETNKDKGFTKINSLPKLVFMSANNHLYPIIDREERETIFKTYSLIGGGMKKQKSQEKTKPKNNNTQKIFIHYGDMIFYALLGHVRKLKQDDDSNNNYRIVITKRGLCNTLFYDEVLEKIIFVMGN